MDAVEFLKEANRMCCSLGCDKCELNRSGCNVMGMGSNPCDVVKVVEQWSKDHPRKTRLQDFLEKHPKAPLTSYGQKIPKACAQDVGYCASCKYLGNKCHQCWNEPVEE